MMLTETIICDNGELTMSDLVCSADLLSGSVHFVPMAVIAMQMKTTETQFFCLLTAVPEKGRLAESLSVAGQKFLRSSTHASCK